MNAEMRERVIELNYRLRFKIGVLQFTFYITHYIIHYSNINSNTNPSLCIIHISILYYGHQHHPICMHKVR